MTEREAFERRFEAAVREWADRAPTDIDERALVRSLAAGTPRGRRIVAVPLWRLPGLGLAWALVVLGLLVTLGVGLVASGALRDLNLFTVAPAPTHAPATVPAVVSSPAVPTPTPGASGSPPASPQASAAPAPVPSQGPSPAAVQAYAGTLAWSGFDRLPRFYAGRALTDPIVGGITAGGPGFVVVGSDWVDAEGAVAVAWTSDDGLAWAEHPIGSPGPTSALTSPALSSVTTGGGMLVAVGRVGIWRSTDGLTWEQAAPSSGLGGIPLRVARGRAGFVAIGRGLGEPCQGRAWTSADGASWRDVALPDADHFCPTAVAGSASGYVVVGNDPLDGGPVVLASSDGVSWSRAPAQPSLAWDADPEGVAWTGDRWTAFGSFLPSTSADQGVQVWQSTDGLAWSRTSFLQPTGPFACDPGSVHMLDLTGFGPGYVAVGSCTANPELVGIAWTSATGGTWQGVLGRVRPMSGVASNGTRLVAVGSDWPDLRPIVTTAVLAP